MNKLIFALASMLFLLGCAFQTSQETDYRVGYAGLNLEYITFPDYQVYEKEDFLVQIKAENRGAYDLDKGVIVLGYPSSFIQAEPGRFSVSQVLHGSSVGFPIGEANFYDAEFKAKPIFAAEKQSFDITATACYKYTNVAEMLACVGPRTGLGSCNFKQLNRNLNLSRGQGSPLAVTEVEETIIEMGQGKVIPRFRIVVANMGKGNVFRNPATNVEKMCSSSGVGDDLNRFDFAIQLSKDYTYDSKSPGQGRFSCPAKFKLEDDKVELICSLKEPIDAGNTYSTLFKIQLDYGYSTSITKQVTVARPLTQ